MILVEMKSDMSEKQTTKQKIDAILGIDDFLADLDKSSTEIKDTMAEVSDDVKANLEKIDSAINQADANGIVGPQILVDMNSSMKQVEDLIDMSKKIFKHIYESIIATDLLDSELVSAAGKFLESIHINIAEFLSMYKDRQKFVEKIKVMTFAQQQKKELMELKHKQDLEKLKFKAEQNVVDVDENLEQFDQNKIINMLDDLDKEDEEKENSTLSS